MNSNKLENSENQKIDDFIATLCNDDGVKRKKAREKLKSFGESVLVNIEELIESEKHICRWEAMKVIEEIGSPRSIPLFIEALEDDESDIRWIAAEGLINVGEPAIKPLLNLVIEKHNSVFVLNGVHHVFSSLDKRNKLPKSIAENELLDLLKHPNNGARLTMVVYNILEELD